MRKETNINMQKSVFKNNYKEKGFIIKALLVGLTGVSLCMANISGIVTDTGTTPIVGAVVQLENGRQTATTDTDGKFSLTINTAILSGNSKSSPSGLSARISGNILNVTIAEQAAVEIATFDINGKLLYTVLKALDAGTHSIGLLQRGTGVYFYKVKTGKTEIVIKCNAFGGISSEKSELSQGSSSNRWAKQAKAAAVKNDVIAVTKTGLLNYRCVIGNFDTSGVVINMIANAGNVNDTDGNVYQSVRIGTQVWMTENLRVTKYNDGSPIPLDSSKATWKDTTPKYCYYNNTTNADSIKRYGVLYNWFVADTKKLAPAGWHVPTDAEWDILQNYLIAKGYNWDATITGNKIAQSLASKTDWYIFLTTGTPCFHLPSNNRSGFSAHPGGFRYNDGNFLNQVAAGYWWSASKYDSTFACCRFLSCGYDSLLRSCNSNKSFGCSVRLVRD